MQRQPIARSILPAGRASSARAAWCAAAALLCAAWALVGCGGGGAPPAGGSPPSGGASGPGEGAQSALPTSAGAPAGEAAGAGASAVPGAPSAGATSTTQATAAGAASGQAGPAAGQTGSIAGRVKFTGPAPKPGRIEVTKDTAVCGAHPIVHEDLVVGADGGLENVVVSIQGARAGGGPGKLTTELRQTGCVYHPHVSVVPAGQPLAIFNDDGILHNIHTFSTLNPAFNKAQPKFQKRIEVKFDKPETIKVTCDAHQWMSAWIVVTDHPYVAVSDAGGAFRLDGLPPGKYTARLWHEKLGERTQPVEVRAGQASDLAVELR